MNDNKNNKNELIVTDSTKEQVISKKNTKKTTSKKSNTAKKTKSTAKNKKTTKKEKVTNKKEPTKKKVTPKKKIVKKEEIQEVKIQQEENIKNKDTIILDTEEKKNFKNSLKDIHSNNEIAKALWQSDNIEESIKEEIDYQENLEEETERLIEKHKKYNVVEPFIIILLLIILFIAMYIILFKNSTSLLKNAINNITNDINNTISDINKYTNNINNGFKISATTSTTNLEYSAIKDYTYEYSIYNKDNNYYGYLNIVDKLNTKYLYTNNTLYIKTDGYYYPLMIENKYKINPLNIKYEELDNILNKIKAILESNIEINTYKKSKDTLNNTKVNVLDISLTKEEINNILNNTRKLILEDKELLTDIKNTLNITDTELDILNKEIILDSDINIIVYTKGIKERFVGIEITKDNKKVFRYINNDTKEISLNINDFKIDIELSNKNLSFTYNNIKLIDIEKDKDTYNFQVSNILDNYKGSFSIKNNDVTFSIADTNNKDNNLELIGNLTSGNEDMYFDTTDAVDIKDLTNEEVEDIRVSFYNIIYGYQKIDETLE